MATMSKAVLSASTDGRGIKVTTVGPLDGTDTIIHTAVASNTDMDLVTLWVFNNDTVERKLYLGWGGTTIPDDQTIVSVPPQNGLMLLCTQKIIKDSLVVVASGEVANQLIISGEVDQIRA